MAVETQSIDTVTRVREAGDTTWLTLVCSINTALDHTNDVSEKDTKCGTFYGVKDMKGNYTGSAVSNAVPGVNEASYNTVLNWQKNKTPVEFLHENEAYTAENGNNIAEGAAIHVFAVGKFVQTTLTDNNGEVLEFSFTYKPTTINISGTSA
jgi:hypothetical protein